MAKKTANKFTERAAAIFSGDRAGAEDKLVQDISSKNARFARVFLSFIRHIGLTPRAIDESKLKTTDVLSYLSETQNVYCVKEELAPLWYKKDFGDFIGYEAVSGMPVIIERGILGYIAHNGFSGKSCRIDEKNVHEYKDVAIIVYPLFDNVKTVTSEIKAAVKSVKKDIVFMYAMTTFTSLIGVFLPLITATLAEHGVILETKKEIIVLGAVITFSIFVTTLINLFINRTKARIETKISLNTITRIQHKIMSIPPAYEKKIAKRLISSIMRMLSAISQITGAGISIIVYLTQCVMILLVIQNAKSGITVYLLRLLLFDIVVSGLLLYRVKHAKQKEDVAHDKFTTFRKELLDNIEAIKNSGIEDRMYYRFAVEFDEYETHNLYVEHLTQWAGVINSMLGGVGIFVITLSVYKCGFTDVAQIAKQIALFTLLLGYIPQVMVLILTIVSNLPNLAVGKKIMEAPTERTESDGITEKVTGDIELRNVTFAYSDDSVPIINDLSLKIKRGEYVGIVGESGCGKSTLVKLLLGFEKPQYGMIKYDNVSIDKFAIKNLRWQFGVVLQDAAIISGSIQTNIGMSEEPDIEKVIKAAKAAAIYDEIEAMPMKFNTYLSGDSALISGGQKQRILLARALMNDPKILILDEATSSLDNIAQRKLKENLDALGVTRIAIAHRLSTVRDCDKIIVLDKGVIVEEGTFNELLERGGKFAKMAKRNM